MNCPLPSKDLIDPRLFNNKHIRNTVLGETYSPSMQVLYLSGNWRCWFGKACKPVQCNFFFFHIHSCYNCLISEVRGTRSSWGMHIAVKCLFGWVLWIQCPRTCIVTLCPNCTRTVMIYIVSSCGSSTMTWRQHQ